MNARLALFIYNLLFPIAFLAMLPNLCLRLIRRGNCRHKFGQRFTIYDPQVRARITARPRIWVHSISVGETFLALKLVRKMRQLDPSAEFILSITTSTGFALADKNATEWLEVIYNPIDALPFVQRALSVIRPTQLIFIEALWPNLLLGAKKRGIPVAMIPRLSQRSGRRFAKFRFLTGGFFHALDCLCAQETEDISRLEAVGADSAKIHDTGSIKFDHADDAPSRRTAEFRDLVRNLGVPDTAPILLAGSTFPGEEKILVELYLDLRKKFPDLFLILVPRHVERTPQIIEELAPFGLKITLRTSLSATAGEKGSAKSDNIVKHDSLLVDTTGELRDWYGVASVIFIGKSLEGYGGQNPVEAAAAGKPVIAGPRMENFANVMRLLIEHQAAIQVSDAAALKTEIARLLADPDLCRRMGANAPGALVIHQGAAARAARLLLDMRNRPPIPE